MYLVRYTDIGRQAWKKKRVPWVPRDRSGDKPRGLWEAPAAQEAEGKEKVRASRSRVVPAGGHGPGGVKRPRVGWRGSPPWLLALVPGTVACDSGRESEPRGGGLGVGSGLARLHWKDEPHESSPKGGPSGSAGPQDIKVC